MNETATSSGGAGSPVADGQPVPILATRGICKAYGGHEALKGIDLEVSRGERICIVGPSGSGKSTFLRCCNLLETPTAGRLEFNGQQVFHQESKRAKAVRLPRKEEQRFRAKITMVFQQFDLFPHLTALENVAVAPRRVLDVPTKQARERARELIGSVGLAQFADAYPRTLSGGQQQRIAIVRALAMEPEMVLFDEPTSALDPEMVGEVLGLMRRLADQGLTMVIVTHEMGFAREVADRVVVMDDGSVIEVGQPDQVFGNAIHPRTRRFFDAVIQRPGSIPSPAS